MASYNIRLRTSAASELEALPPDSREHAVVALAALAGDPFPVAAERIGSGDHFRMRLEGCVIVYSLEVERLRATVARVRASGADRNSAV